MTSVSINNLIGCDPGCARFFQLSPPSRAVPRAPDFIFGNPRNEVFSSYFRHYEWMHEQGVWEIVSSRVYHPFIVKKNDEFLNFPFSNIHSDHIDPIILEGGQFNVSVRALSGLHVLLAGPGYGIFGHWLVDFLPKLYTLEAAGFSLASLSFILPHDTPSFGYQLLSLFGISKSQIHILEPTESVEVDLLVPTTSHNGVRGQNFAEASVFLRDRLPRLLGTDARNIFVSRPGGNRDCLNRAVMEDIASQLGFIIFQPEKFSLLDQINVYHSARIIVGEYGSALHLSLFSQSGTIVCGLRGSGFHPGFIQSATGRTMGQPTGYIFGDNAVDDPFGPFNIPETDARECFQWLLGSPRF